MVMCLWVRLLTFPDSPLTLSAGDQWLVDMRTALAPGLLIPVDCESSNKYRPRLWKYALLHDLLDVTGVGTMVSHYRQAPRNGIPLGFSSYFIFH